MLGVNRKMTTEQLKQVMTDARNDYRFFTRLHRVLIKAHKEKHKIVRDVLESANRSTLRYQAAEALLSNR